MTAPRTEALHPNAKGLDTLSLRDIAALLSKSQTEAAATTMNCLNAIASGASAIAMTLKSGGTLHYIAAGSSGLMAAADAMELGGTFSIPAHQIKIHMAGGLPTGVVMPGDTEDDIAGLAQSLANLTSKDTVIAISASGTTPYTVAAAKITKDAGATLISIANNAGTPLLDLADHAIHLDTPAEVLSGSTRMGAGTAQKIALNMLSTLMAVELGHVFDGMMVNLHADNIKLRGRAIGIVSTIADLHKQLGASMVYVTHDQTEAMTLADKIVVLRDGYVEQIGSPMELYNNPANQFVAGFLGSPAMNFIPASLLTEGDTRTMGVRPEDLSVQSGGPLAVTVSHVEMLGGDTNVIAHIGAHQITARLFGQHSIMDGETLTLGFDKKSALYFDHTGARLRG